MSRIAEVMNVPVTVKLSSDFDDQSRYRELLQGVRTDKGEYARRELADILWYRRHRRVKLKLGWLIDPKPTRSGFDERLFRLGVPGTVR